MLDGLPILNWSPAALAGLAVLMVLTGWLVPKRTLDRLERDNNRLREANDKLLTVVGENTRQTEELLVQARTTNALLSALPRAREDDP
jgi:hypothetical protein